MKPLLITLAALLAAAPAAAQESEPTADADAGAVADADVDADVDAEADTEADAVDAAADADAVAPAPEAPSPADPEPQPSDAPPPPAGPALTFANSFFSWTTAATAHTFAPGAQLTYDPTVQMSFSLTPRFYLTDTLFLWANQALSYELTDSNEDTYNHEPLLSDTLLDLRQILVWEGFAFQLQGRVGFPLSKASQAAGRILQTGLGLVVSRSFPEAAGFTVALSGAYRRWWATTNVAQTSEPYPGQCLQPAPGEAPVCTQASGLTTARDILLGGVTLNVTPFENFNVSFSGFLLGTYNFEIGDAQVPINGGVITATDDSPSHWRAFTYFSLAVAYDVLPWLNLQLGIQNAGVVAPLFDSTGNARSPFSPDTQIFLSTTVGLDTLVGEIAGGDEDDGLTPEERQRRRQGLASTGRRLAF